MAGRLGRLLIFRREVAEIVAGGEDVSFGLNQDAANVGIRGGAVDRVAKRLIHVAGQRVFLLGPVQRQRQHAAGDIAAHMVGHGILAGRPEGLRYVRCGYSAFIRRCRMMLSASAMIRSMSSRTVGMS